MQLYVELHAMYLPTQDVTIYNIVNIVNCTVHTLLIYLTLRYRPYRYASIRPNKLFNIVNFSNVVLNLEITMVSFSLCAHEF